MHLFMVFFAIKPSEFFLKGFCHSLLYKQERGRCMQSKPAQWQHMQRYYSFIVEMLLTPVISYFPLVMDLWKGLWWSRLISSCPKFLVNLLVVLSYLAWNFIMLNNILTSLLLIYRACFISSRHKERGTLLIHCTFFMGLRMRCITLLSLSSHLVTV